MEEDIKEKNMIKMVKYYSKENLKIINDIKEKNIMKIIK